MRSGRLVCLLLLAVGLAACSSPPPSRVDRRGLRAAAREMPPPPYHRPSAAWRREHHRWLEGERALFSPGECLLCHRAETSCNPCHAYVGAPAVARDGRRP